MTSLTAVQINNFFVLNIKKIFCKAILNFTSDGVWLNWSSRVYHPPLCPPTPPSFLVHQLSLQIQKERKVYKHKLSTQSFSQNPDSKSVTTTSIK